MNDRPAFPPVYRPFAVTEDLDPFDRALALTEDDPDPGTLLWSTREDVFEWAVVLAPEQPTEQSLPVIMAGALGLADALGSLIPPVVSVTFGWPDRILVNGKVVGGVRVTMAEASDPANVPDWLILGFSISNRTSWSADALAKDVYVRTTLEDEGCEVDPMDFLEAFSRHFLAWVNRWQNDGVTPVQQAWMSRTAEIGKEVAVEIDGQIKRGLFQGLNDNCGLELIEAGQPVTLNLDRATASPTWSI